MKQLLFDTCTDIGSSLVIESREGDDAFCWLFVLVWLESQIEMVFAQFSFQQFVPIFFQTNFSLKLHTHIVRFLVVDILHPVCFRLVDSCAALMTSKTKNSFREKEYK